MSSIIVYGYGGSPYTQLVKWYLALRGIGYTECPQPMTMPRPDVAGLGVGYRRIPLTAIGRDVFCDTPLILDELEERTKGQGKQINQPSGAGFERFLRQWSGDSLFQTVAGMLPSDLLTDEFLRDRAQLTGATWDRKKMNLARPFAVSKMRQEFHFVETVLLADNKQWVQGTSEPSLGDLYAVWPFAWVVSIPGALKGTDITPDTFPRTFDWISRFVSIATAKSRAIKVNKVNGDTARQTILGSSFRTEKEAFDQADPCGYHLNSLVDVSPTDWGKHNPTRGRLVGLSMREFVLEVEEKNGSTLRVHFPRRGFAVKTVAESKI
ncbi:hypothetical protein ASPWEDRAFT_67338 [Aspergillus wentii DTO 134E9]|uniref:Uncharacterized protein n=1 Tax=Aspergillus wentii DTO 134E9 TaxID=1073089 RepID=A0A1L9RQ16_ASPWE|nr:uncharacterized protein ASPWEDRAFT_67338 [Aspergillus wentii DTO 134E9]KAI9928463.1 hypothetical protein MW887_002508 [Aspergillus wentii]OJJ37045.1 hypothetical protein ASPWEDRAFT_67338 [Aspergillus wentii DTO 134E9]